MTSGRLTYKNRALIKSTVEAEYDTGSIAKAVRMAQQLVFATPEFHSTGVTRHLNNVREISGYEEPPSAPYKAVGELIRFPFIMLVIIMMRLAHNEFYHDDCSCAHDGRWGG